ncbi:hypothetical protein HWQ17_18340 [Enterobacter pasteurii]|uniref:hypothetical protein n=1 Tax=Enterobacter pasteurii TaxID=3029761 RepID=UPI0011DE05E2|nr:hypothetical protein [Enterobacter pasteurii]QLA69459.1 hypothetical protein HWQ17_18340 [Enterobacter pasteurii]
MKDKIQVKNLKEKELDSDMIKSNSKTEIINIPTRKFLFGAMIAIIAAIILIPSIILFLIKVSISPFLPPESLFVFPIVISLILGLIYFFLPRFRLALNKVCDIGITVPVAVVSLITISKPLGGDFFDSITMENNIVSIIILSFIAVCAITKTIIFILPNFDKVK